MKTRVLGLPALAILAAAGCNDGRGAAPEALGDAKAAVVDGTFDATSQYPYVGRFESSTGFCTAELVTPNWILTANHCITGDTNGPNPGGMMDNYRVSFDAQGFSQGTPPQNTLFTHTYNPNDPGIIVRNQGPINGGSNEDVATDLALVRLDQPVPAGVVPLAPIAGFSAPAGSPPCTSISENGGYVTEVGYGSTVVGGNTMGRNYATSGGWTWQPANPGDQFLQNNWMASSYNGSNNGDSGGALIWENQVCGTISVQTSYGTVLGNIDPELDAPNNTAWLAQNLRNSDGSLQGTCNVTSPGFLGIGYEAGGTQVTIQGAGFSETFPPVVLFGGVPSDSVTCSSSSQCVAAAPPNQGGAAPVVVEMWNASPSGFPNGGAGITCPSTNLLSFYYVPDQPSCSAAWSCQSNYTGATTISCVGGGSGLSLWRSTAGGPRTEVTNPDTTPGGFVDYYDPPAGTSITYWAAATDAGGTTFSAPTTPVVTTDCSCHTAVECPTNGCGTMPDGCGGILNCGACTSGVCGSNNTCITPPTCKSPYVYCPAAGACETVYACSKVGSGGPGCSPAQAKAGGC
jgi:Trypsin/IPT/TIG domain